MTGTWHPGLESLAGKGEAAIAVAIAIDGARNVSREEFFFRPAGAPDWRQFNVHTVAARAGHPVPIECRSAYFSDAHWTRVRAVALWLLAVGVHHTAPRDLFAAADMAASHPAHVA